MFDQNWKILSNISVHVDRDLPRSRWGLHEDEPLSGVFSEIQKIRLFVHLKIQFLTLRSTSVVVFHTTEGSLALIPSRRG